MTKDEAKTILTEYNKWRRSEPPYDDNVDNPDKYRRCRYNPKKIGEAIDTLVEASDFCIEATGGVQHHFEEKGNKPPVKIELLFSDDVVHLEKVNDNYRLSFFNKDNHWAGDITFSKEGTIINNDLHEND